MEIEIKETGSREEFWLVDRETGRDWSRDFVVGADPDNFIYDYEKDIYVCDQASYEWWDRVVKEHQKAGDAKIEFLASIEDREEREGAEYEIIEAMDCDLEDQPGRIMTTIEEIKNR